jgi:hypothetical protein
MNKRTLLNNVMPGIIDGYEVEYFVIVYHCTFAKKNRTKKAKPQPSTTMSMVACKHTLNEVVST